MTRWQEVRGINPQKSDVLISAGCRYMNSASYPDIHVLASIIGLEEIEMKEPEIEETTEVLWLGEPEDKPCTEE